MNTVWKEGYATDDVEQLNERLYIIEELNKYVQAFTPEKEIQKTILGGVSKELSINMSSNGHNDIRLIEISEQTGCNISELRNRLLSYYLRVFKPAYTGYSNVEKEFVINLYSNDVLDKKEIQGIYPALYSYLFGTAETTIVENDEYKNYLQAYRESKVAEKDNEYLKQHYESGCANSTNLYSMYYALQRQEVAVAPYVDDADLYILDGVGAEYLPLLVELIKNRGYEIELCNYATCHLPSITEINKAYLSDLHYKEWVLIFDREVVHGNGEYYKTALNLRKAFDTLERIIKNIVSESEGKRIVITADHGATARARWTYTQKKYSFEDADHEGRCCKISDKAAYSDTEDYIVFEDETKPGKPYVISLNETSLNNKPKFENHGGATIEEMLVPVIVAMPGEKKKKKSFNNRFGTFSYRDVPVDVYPYGVNIIEEGGYSFMMASKEKALCDKLYELPPVKNLKELEELLFNDMRIDETEFDSLNREDIYFIAPKYRVNNLKHLEKYLRRRHHEQHNR